MYANSSIPDYYYYLSYYLIAMQVFKYITITLKYVILWLKMINEYTLFINKNKYLLPIVNIDSNVYTW